MRKAESRADTRHSDERDRGAVAILAALLLIMLLTIISLSTDVGAWYVQGQGQQREADVAALTALRAYDDEIRDHIAIAGVSAYAELTPAEKANAENEAMQEAVDAVVAGLTKVGTGFSSSTTIDPTCCVPPPGFSSVTVTADDGKEVTITRDTHNQMVVEISKLAQQYFSGVVRDAPEISRRSTAAFSNCGATCDISITFTPPDSAFTAIDAGDGYAPLPYGNDEVWAINHHVRNVGEGEIICMSRVTKSSCTPTGQFSLGELQTGNRPVDFIDEAGGRIFFATRKPSKEDSGIGCFDLVTRALCDKDGGFKNLWDQKTTTAFPGVLNLTGPFGWTDPEKGLQLYMMNQEGKLKCIKAYKIFDSCGSWNTAAEGHPEMPDKEDTPRIINAEQYGSQIYFTHILPAGVLFHCWDLDEEEECDDWDYPEFVTTLSGEEDRRLTHFRYHPVTQLPTGICVTDLDVDTNACFGFDGSGPTSIPGLNAALAPLDATYAGDTFSWDGKRTFFAGGDSNRTLCWDWVTGTSCGVMIHELGTYPYAYAHTAPDCLIGLGHGSTFFSFDPMTLSSCTDTVNETTINPCTCLDGAARWGEASLDWEFLEKLDKLEATIVQSDGVVVVDGVDPAVPYVDATFDVESKLNPDGSPQWSSAEDVALELRVQPTLAK